MINLLAISSCDPLAYQGLPNSPSEVGQFLDILEFQSLLMVVY